MPLRCGIAAGVADREQVLRQKRFLRLTAVSNLGIALGYRAFGAYSLRVDSFLAAFIGAPNVIWLPRGLTADYGGTATNGHVDLLAAYEAKQREKLSTELVTDETLGFLFAEDFRVLRNEIYARRGRIFKDVNLQKYFESQAWYKPNPDFKDDMLNEIESKNLAKIREAEAMVTRLQSRTTTAMERWTYSSRTVTSTRAASISC